MEDNKPIKLQTGLITDVDPIDQPKGSYTFMLNGVADAHDGKKTSRVFEPGNELCFSLKDGYKVVGTIYTENDEMIIFSTNGTMSEIGKAKQCHYTTLVNADLGFDTKYPITGEYRVRGGCDPTIYWNDGNNKDRYFILNQPDDFKSDGDWDINRFDFVPGVSIPNIEIDSINNSGGSIALGTYRFIIDLLDGDLNLLYRSDATQQVAIYDESTVSAYDNIDGGLNIDTFSENIGGVDLTTKSIDLEISNLDETAAFVRLHTIRYVNAVADIQTYGLLRPVVSDTVSVTYDGFNPDRGDTLGDVDEFLIPKFSYTSSKVMEQVQNRLVRANVRTGDRDYVGYQALVNQIESNYIIEESEITDTTSLGNPKNPLTYYERVGYMGGEVYAFGIVFVFSDGTESPVFHIPGRAKIDGLDNTVFTVNTDITVDDLQHITPPNGIEWQPGDTIEKWRVTSTSNGGGTMDYYELSINYPETLGCDGVTPIYGDLAGTPIRHHKFPDRAVEKHYNGKARHYGIEFTNVPLPDDAIGYYIVRAQRTNNDRLIFDKGITVKQSKNTFTGGNTQGVNFITYFNDNAPSDYTVFSSSKTQFNQDNLGGDHIACELLIGIPEVDLNTKTYPSTEASDAGFTFLVTRLRFNYIDSNIVPNRFNRKINFDSYIEPNTVNPPFGGFDVTTRNSSEINTVLLQRVEGEIPDVNPSQYNHRLYYTANKIIRNVYSNLESVRYYKTHNGILGGTSAKVFGGDTFISRLTLSNLFLGGPWNYFGYMYQNIFVESEINSELRHEGLEANQYYSYDENLIDWFADKVSFVNTDGDRVERAGFWKDFYGYNTNYSINYRTSNYSPLPITYDYCDECLAQYPYRIIFSPVSFSEEIYDNYRVNAVDDYIELPAHRGEITGVKFKNNQLLVHTKETTFLLQPNPQTIATDQNTAYLNTGDFLSIPPYELQQTDTGFGGSQSRVAYINNEHGYFWVDQMNGEVYKWSNKFETISSLGMSQWFVENLPSQLNKQTNELSNTDYSYLDSIGDSAGIGVQLAYDPRLERLILRKKDFKRIKADPIGTDFYNKKKYENKSFTISFDLLGNYWTSYHSYHPDWMYNDRSTMYALKKNESWKFASKGSYLSYFGELAPFVIELVENDYVTHDLHNIQYVAVTERYDEESDEWVVIDTTFDQGIFYNDRETSGLIQLEYVPQNTNPYGTTFLPDFVGKVVKRKDNYAISGMRDVAISRPVMSKAWDEAQGVFNQYTGYIDKVPVNFDLNTNQYELKNINGKWVKSRLIYNQTDPRFRMTIHLFNKKIYKLS